MPPKLRWTLAAGCALLFALILVLFVRGPRFETSSYGEPNYMVLCGSIMTVGWPSDGSFVSTEDGGWWGDHVEDGPDSTPSGAREGFARDCSERRDTYLGFMIVLSAPATLLGAAAVAGRRTGASAA